MGTGDTSFFVGEARLKQELGDLGGLAGTSLTDQDYCLVLLQEVDEGVTGFVGRKFGTGLEEGVVMGGQLSPGVVVGRGSELF